MCSDKDRRNGYASVDKMLLKLQSVHFWHLEIDDQAIRETIWQRRYKIPT
jgi:hypothetical protein